jgi:hypothetical protein
VVSCLVRLRRRPGPVADDAVGAHQPLDPLVVDGPAAPPQLGMDPRGAVGATGAGMETADLADQLGLLPLTLSRSRRGRGGPGVVGRAGHPAAWQAAATANPAALWASTQR